jgi:CRISPR-associated endonuclease/helicase Cas3
MITLDVDGDRAQVWPENPFGVALAGQSPLYHQWRTFEASQTTALILNTYPTGVGKTLAALLPLLGPHRDHSCLFVAPTNELLEQHCRDAAAFVARTGLPHQVLPLTAAHLDQLKGMPGIAAHRRAERFYQFLRDPRAALGLTEQRPLLLVLNPDLLYAGLFFQFNPQDRRNLFRLLAGAFRYLIVDEFHYYHQKQFAAFLFFLGFLKSYGYFDDGQQVCLLSATPHPHLRRYLDALELPTADVSPDQPGPADLPTVPILAALRLRVYSTAEVDGLESLFDRDAIAELGARLAAGEHGAVISGALWRINQIYDQLQAAGLGARIARMTGVETADARAAARAADLLLATPTVDVGYNFERHAKARQSLDLLYFDARFADEAGQRLGRAGRVLGKPVTDRPSEVVALLPDPLYQALRPYDGQRLTRRALAAALAGVPALSHRHNLFAYLRSGAIGEAFLPIYELYQMTAPTEREDVRGLFEEIRRLFGENSRLTFDRLAVRTRYYLLLRKDLNGIKEANDRAVAKLAERFVAQTERDNGVAYPAAERAGLVAAVKRPGTPAAEAARNWVDQQLRRFQVLKAPFSFREAFSPPEAWIDDPRRLLSSAPISRYDLLHVVANYQAQFYPDRAAWQRTTGHRVEEAAPFYCTLRHRLAPADRRRLRLRLVVAAGAPADWEGQFCGHPVALHELTLRAEQAPLPSVLIDGWRAFYVVALVLAEDSRPAGQLKALARDAGIRITGLTVTFLETAAERSYVCALGTSALLAYAELRRAIHFQQRQEASGGPAIVI